MCAFDTKHDHRGIPAILPITAYRLYGDASEPDAKEPVKASEPLAEVLSQLRYVPNSGTVDEIGKIRPREIFTLTMVQAAKTPEAKQNLIGQLELVRTASEKPLEQLQALLLLKDLGEPIKKTDLLATVERMKQSLQTLQDPNEIAWTRLLSKCNWSKALDE